MKERWQRVAAVVRADLLIRFRRMSTLVVFLLLTAFAWMWVPDPATGRTLLQLNGRRAIYNSAAVGMATATLAAIFVGLFGFYVISNALRRDVTTRCGFVIASTTMRSSEYLFGKFAGNIAFLATFIGGFMLSSMAMLVVRGEAPLQPLLFVWQYVMLVPPAIVMVAAVAVLFESVPALAGRFGDVVYFFAWAGGIGIVAATRVTKHGPGIAGYFDFSGFVFLLDSMQSVLHTTSMSIGQSQYDMSKPPFTFGGIPLLREWIAPRIAATLLPLGLLVPARFFFHRFDPARTRAAAQRSRRNVVGWIGNLARPLARVSWMLAPRFGQSLAGAARLDALVTLSAAPLVLIAAAGVAVATAAADSQAFARSVVPLAFAVAAIAIAEMSCREVRSGTTPLAWSVPRLKEQFVWWKLMATSLVAALVLAGPLIRLLASPARLPAFAVGFLFVVACATAAGTLTSNPKTFIVLFLSFWYLVVNDRGRTPALDFTGLAGVATPLVTIVYLLIAIAATAMAATFHSRRVGRA